MSESYCQPCTNSKYCPGDKTWSSDCSLTSSGYAPYRQEYYCGPNGCGANINSTLSSAWTIPGNITPDNSPGTKDWLLKEKFCYSNGKSTYSRARQTWVPQRPYSTG